MNLKNAPSATSEKRLAGLKANGGLPRVLVVDDEEDIRHILGETLQATGYRCELASSVDDALHALTLDHFALIILDYQLGADNGFSLIEAVPDLSERSVIIMMSGRDEMGIVIGAMRRGVTDFITKPFSAGEVRERVHAAFKRWAFRRDARSFEKRVEEVISISSSMPETAGQSKIAICDEAVRALGAALNLRDTESAEHCARVSRNGLVLARHCGFSEDALVRFRWGAYLHDIGKIGIPDRILRKPVELKPDEMEVVRRHPELGYQMASQIGFLRGSTAVILHHHERFDGSGYPGRLKGDAIPLEARIFSVIDTMDAMLNDRPYRRATSFADLEAELRDGGGRQFDPRVVSAFLEIPVEEWLIGDGSEGTTAKASRRS